MDRREDSINGLMKLKMLFMKLQRGIFSSAGGATMVPNDVKEGQFAVVAVNGGETKRFVLDLGYLRNPGFLGLLEQAEKEYGFQQKGVLVVPCPPEKLQNVILKCNRHRRISTEW